MNSVIDEHCVHISDHKQTISKEELKSTFDSIVAQLVSNDSSTVDDYYRIIHTLKRIYISPLIDPTIIDNKLFHLLRNFLVDLLNKWSNQKVSLTDREEQFFREIVDLVFKIIQQLRTTNQIHSSMFQSWFLNEHFFQTIAEILADISINSSYYLHQDDNMRSFITLIQSIQGFQRGIDQFRNHPYLFLLMEPIVKCLSSSTYVQLVKNLETTSDRQSDFEEFLLYTLPDFCVWNRSQRQVTIIEQLCHENMLKSYAEIYELFLPSIDRWEDAITEAIFYITAILRYVAYYPSTREYLKENRQILDSVFMLLNADCLMDNILTTDNYNSQTNVTDSAISFLFNLSHGFQFLAFIRQNKYFSTDIFLRLKDAKVNRVQLHAYMILAKVLNEQDIQRLDHVDRLLAVFFEYLIKAVNDPSHTFEDVPVKDLLASLKAFVQHDEIKEEIVKQNYLGFLVRCATEKDLHVGSVLRISLEIIWALTFNETIHRMLKNDFGPFITYLKDVLTHSNEEGVRAAAKGVLWKLENEKIVEKQILNRNLTDESTEKYDLMISYSHLNKDLCAQLYQHLVSLKYRVWLDLQNMYGSTLQSMAHAIESSEIILICMSSPYKQSAYCRSEAEYAFTRQRHIIPLMMEKQYQPDGWLGFICASKLYVDFAKFDFDEAVKKLDSQIKFLQRQAPNKPSPSVGENEHPKQESPTHDDRTTPTVPLIQHPAESAPMGETNLLRRPSNINNDYTNRYIEWWTHEDVLNFLYDKELHVLRLLFAEEHQFDGHSLYKLYQECQANTELTYRLLDSQLNHAHNHQLSYLTYVHFLGEIHKQISPIDIKQLIRYFFWSIWKKFQQYSSQSPDN